MTLIKKKIHEENYILIKSIIDNLENFNKELHVFLGTNLLSCL